MHFQILGDFNLILEEVSVSLAWNFSSMLQYLSSESEDTHDYVTSAVITIMHWPTESDAISFMDSTHASKERTSPFSSQDSYIYKCVCVCVRLCVCLCVSIGVCLYVYECVFVYMHTYVCSY